MRPGPATLLSWGSRRARAASVVHPLGTYEPDLYAFLLSFLVIANLWSTQHHVVRSVVVHDPIVTRLMVVWPHDDAQLGGDGADGPADPGGPELRDGGAATDPVLSWTTAALAVPATGYYPQFLLLLTGVIARGYRRLRGGSAATGRVGD